MVLDAVTSPFCLLFSSLTTITCRTPSPPSRNIKRHDGVSTIWGLTSLYNVRRNTSECRTRATKTGHTHTKTQIYPAVSSNELVIFHLFAYKFRNSLGKKRGGGFERVETFLPRRFWLTSSIAQFWNKTKTERNVRVSQNLNDVQQQQSGVTMKEGKWFK